MMKEFGLLKEEIAKRLCYTELVYSRINKKLTTNYDKEQIIELMLRIVLDANEDDIVKTGKNFYITNPEWGIKVTVNSFTYRVITVDKAKDYKIKH